MMFEFKFWNTIQRVVTMLLALSTTGALAQSFPAKPVRILVPYEPGGAVDVTARLLQQGLSQRLGQPVIVENRPGATGRIGAEAVSRGEPDGHLLLYTPGGTLTTWQARPEAPDSVRNLSPVTAGVASVGAVALRRDLPMETMAELIEFARRNPGKLSYGSSGVASFQHLIGERLRMMGIDLLHVPYKGLPAAMTAVTSGQVDVAITNLAIGLPLFKEGKVKLLALTQSSRFEAAPTIPAITDALPGFEMPAPWYGFWAPPKLPAPIATRLASDIGRTLQAPEVKAKLNGMSMVGITATPAQFTEMVRETASVYQQIIKAANIQMD